MSDPAAIWCLWTERVSTRLGTIHTMTYKLPSIQELRSAHNKLGDVRLFKPDDEQRAAKSTFWASYEGQGPIDVELALQYSGDSQVANWWPQKGFQEWFSNRDEFQQQVDVLAHRALARIGHILNTSADPDILLKASRMALELAKKFPAKTVEAPDKFLDDQIAKMTKEQLREYLRRTAPKLLTVDTTATDNSPSKE